MLYNYSITPFFEDKFEEQIKGIVNDVKRGKLFGYEEHLFSIGYAFGYNVGYSLALSRSRRAYEQYIVTARRRDLHRALCHRLTAHVGKIRHGYRGSRRKCPIIARCGRDHFQSAQMGISTGIPAAASLFHQCDAAARCAADPQ